MSSRRPRALAVAAVALLSSAVALAAKPEIPTRADKVVEHLHGVEVPDPYRWLENGDAPEVSAWTEAQNAVTRRALDAVPGRARLERRLWEVHEIGALGAPEPRAARARPGRYFYTRRDGRQNQPVLYVREASSASAREPKERALVDVNALATDGTRALDWWFPSEDGRLLAYGVSADGTEESVLRVRDVATGRDLPDEISRTRACSLAWLPDGTGFFYTRYPAPGTVPAGEERYHRAVFLHRLGRPVAADVQVFGQGRDLKDWPSVALSPNGRWLAVEVDQGWSRSELFLVDARAAAKRRAGRGSSWPTWPVAEGVDARFQVAEILDDRLVIWTTQAAPRGRVAQVRIGPRGPVAAPWRTLVPESEEVIQSVALVGRTLAIVTLKDASARLHLRAQDGRWLGDVTLPGLGSITALRGERRGDELFFSYTSFFTPTAVYRLDLRAAQAPVPELWRRLSPPLDAAAYEIDRVEVTSRDGTRLPMFLVHRAGLTRDARNPTVLYGYGGFNLSMQPTFSPAIVPFLERGGVYAVAVLRGGGEYGEAWHEAGKRDRKQNVFDDFIAAAEHLIASKVTAPDRLAISGRSNGGLLVLAATTQRPELFRAVVAGVPLADMLRYHRFRIGQLWIPEYGSPDEPADFKWLHAYSPYHRVKNGVRYPAVFIHTAASDTRVDAMHARKMTARLQAATGARYPILLRLERKAGHGAGKPLAKLVDQLTDEWAFLFSQLGMEL